EYEDYDDYEEVEEQEEGYEDENGEAEEYEEVEERKPTQEELDYLELRQKIKESIRKKMKKESGSNYSNSQNKNRKLPNDNYGSFFGPSQPVIAQRVIQESKSLLETQHLASKISSSLSLNRKSSTSTTTGSKPGVCDQPPKVNEVMQKQLQKRRETRDYSFLLSDDAELPAPAKDPPPRNVYTPNSDARSVQVPLKSKQPLGIGSRNVRGGYEERKSVSLNGHMHSKAGSYKFTSSGKPNSMSLDSRKQLGSNNGVGPGRPSGPKALPSRVPLATMEKKAPVQPVKRAPAPAEKKASAPVAKNILPSSRKAQSSNMYLSPPQQHSEQKKLLPEPNRGKVILKQPLASSKSQINKPLKPISSHADHRLKKKPSRPLSDDEDLKALSLVRRMFNTQRFANRDDDDSDMEANFDEIMKEERRSAKLAKEEDEEQLRLIEEEERRERMRKLAKKRKL
ncbi:SPT2 domain-containing protein, partial [Cephalotus follicularis]